MIFEDWRMIDGESHCDREPWLKQSGSHRGRTATKGSGGFPTAERARQEDRFNSFEMKVGGWETAPP